MHLRKEHARFCVLSYSYKLTLLMISLLFLIPIALFILLLSIYLFFWFVKNNQFEDLDKAANQILKEDNKKPAKPHNANRR